MKKVTFFLFIILLFLNPSSLSLYAKQYLSIGLGDFKIKDNLKFIEHNNTTYDVENVNLNYRNIKLIFGITIWNDYSLDFQYNHMTDSEIIQTYSSCSSLNGIDSNCHLVLDSTLDFFSLMLTQKKYFTNDDGFIYGLGFAYNSYKRELIIEYPNPDFDNKIFTVLKSSSMGLHAKVGIFFYNNFETSLEYLTNIGKKDITGTANAIGVSFLYSYFF